MLLRVLVSFLQKVHRAICKLQGFEEICKLLRIARKLFVMSSNKRTRTICFHSNRVAIQRENIFKWFYIYNLLILNCQNSRCWGRFVCLFGGGCLFVFVQVCFLKRKGYYVLNFLQYIFPEGPLAALRGRAWLVQGGCTTGCNRLDPVSPARGSPGLSSQRVILQPPPTPGTHTQYGYLLFFHLLLIKKQYSASSGIRMDAPANYVCKTRSLN